MHGNKKERKMVGTKKKRAMNCWKENKNNWRMKAKWMDGKKNKRMGG